jgi:DNA modification methylase
MGSGDHLDVVRCSRRCTAAEVLSKLSFHGIELSAEYAERGRERLTTFETAGEDVTYDEPGLFAAAEAAS